MPIDTLTDVQRSRVLSYIKEFQYPAEMWKMGQGTYEIRDSKPKNPIRICCGENEELAWFLLRTIDEFFERRKVQK